MATDEIRNCGRKAMLACAAWLALTGATASSIAAQVVRGRLLEEGSGAPLAGAMILLADTAGTQVRRTLTNDQGGFSLRAPQAGTFTLRADRIGYASMTSPPLELAPEAAVMYDMVVPVQAITLANIIVEGERRCVLRPEGGLDVSRVWEEARKALAAAAFTNETSVYRYHVLKYERDLDPEARAVKNERHNFADLVQRQTFVSRPVEVEVRRGEVAWLPLPSPSPREVLRAACAEEEALLWHVIAHLVRRTVILAGRVVDAASGIPVEGANVIANWTGWDVGSSGPGTSVDPRGEGDPDGLMTLKERHGQYEDVTGVDGRFLFCRVPVGPGVVVVATTPGSAAQQGIVLEAAGQIEFMTVYLLN